MLKKVTNFLIASNNLRLMGAFSSHASIPTKLQKVQQTTVKFNVKNADGQWQQIHGIVGQSLFETIVRFKVKGGVNERYCMGGDLTYRPHERPHDPFSSGPTCGMCRIVLTDNWYEKVNEETDGISNSEQATLLVFTDIKKNVRLSCCVPVEKWMDGCTFEIYTPPEMSESTRFR